MVVAALAYFIAAVTPTLEAAAAALPGIVLTWQFFVGLLIRREDIPLYLRWYCSVNFLRYGWDAMMVNQFENVSILIFGGQEVGLFISY
jgi:ABC-type multidrug transport system permease subunit